MGSRYLKRACSLKLRVQDIITAVGDDVVPSGLLTDDSKRIAESFWEVHRYSDILVSSLLPLDEACLSGKINSLKN
jgi:hypothetical protein